jgi:DNA-binding LacI/PurR family transcriptional regulator
MIVGMRPGDRLPPQDELMRRFEVSDTTVLRSLTDLQRAGLIVRRQGSGTYVADREPTGPAAETIPSLAAAAMNRTGMVAVLAQPSESAFFADMIQAVESNLNRVGMAPLLILDPDVGRRIRRAREYAAVHQVIGAIQIGSASLEGAGDLPIILVGESEYEREFCQVSLDNFGAGRRVGEYLWDLGHRGTVVVTIKGAGASDPASAPGVDRFRVAGIRNLWQERGGVWNESWQIAHPFLLNPGDSRAVGVMRSYLEPLFLSSETETPTAIFAAHDEMATVAIRALEEMGLRVPDDVSVIGFNDSGTLATYFRPALTTVRTPSPTLGTLAVHLLLDLLQHPDRRPRSVRLPAEIIIRESTAPPPQAVNPSGKSTSSTVPNLV